MRMIGALLVVLFGMLLTAAAPVVKEKDLPPKYRVWLEEEVVYIISDFERRAFLAMESDRERDMFINAFWKNRDPNLSTPENEFKDEHYKRLAYAREHLGKGTPTPGWRTDMGRVYILLGPPTDMEHNPNTSDFYPLEIWFYQGLTDLGLPPGFTLIFYKPYGAGDYKLYSPIGDGPAKLLVNYTGDANSFDKIFNAIQQKNKSLAMAAFGLEVGENRSSLRPSVATDIMLFKKIPAVPMHRLNDDYARQLLKYRQFIDLEYSTNFVNSAGLVRVWRDVHGRCWLHVQVEPQKLTLEEHEGKLITNLVLNGSLVDDQNRQVYAFQKDVPVQVSVSQQAAISAQTFALQDVIPLIPGKYTFNILIRNTVSKEFFTFERKVETPSEVGVGLDEPLLCYQVKSQNGDAVHPFASAGQVCLPSVPGSFRNDEPLLAMVPVRLDAHDRDAGDVEMQMVLLSDSREGVSVLKTTRIPLVLQQDGLMHLPPLDLSGLKPDYYTLRLQLMRGDRELARRDSLFTISVPRRSAQRPWMVSLSVRPQDSFTDHVLGIQWLEVGRDAEALICLRRAFSTNPLDLKVAEDYCRALLRNQKYESLVEVARSFTSHHEGRRLSGVLGHALQRLGRYQEAAAAYKDFLAYSGTQVDILNAVGDCYRSLEDPDQALIAWERSRELMKDQPGLEEKIKEAKSLRKAQKKAGEAFRGQKKGS